MASDLHPHTHMCTHYICPCTYMYTHIYIHIHQILGYDSKTLSSGLHTGNATISHPRFTEAWGPQIRAQNSQVDTVSWHVNRQSYEMLAFLIYTLVCLVCFFKKKNTPMPCAMFSFHCPVLCSGNMDGSPRAGSGRLQQMRWKKCPEGDLVASHRLGKYTR